jgi:hypothetical protein
MSDTNVFAPAREYYLHLLEWMGPELGVEVPTRSS